MLVSLVIPVFNEEENIGPLWGQLREVAVSLGDVRFEVVFIDDGSTDGTAAKIADLPAVKNLAWKLVELSRNFGQQAAITAGMDHASGEVLIFLDADLQDPPALIPEFIAKYAEGYDVVFGIRKNRKEPLWLRFCFKAFYRIFNSVAQTPMPPDAGDFGLISRRVARLIAGMPEHDRLIRGLRSWVGFRQCGVPYDRPKRFEGTTHYSIGRLIDLALDGIFGFSRVPIRFAMLIGSAVFITAGIYLAKALILTVFFQASAVPGWQSLITLGFMVGGANIIATAVVGEYVVRIYFQSKQRPNFIVSRIGESAPVNGEQL